ncbi:hypothetical protein TSMEX_000069 [Taenia solium]|eukprot:TsM_000116700 transcript=TsM_000116700 gene=TsM_000116700
MVWSHLVHALLIEGTGLIVDPSASIDPTRDVLAPQD